MIFDSKLIVIDVDFFHNFEYDLDTRNNMKHLLQRISGEQNLIIMTNENLVDSVKEIKKLNLRSGYLIANSGAIIYNIAADSQMFKIKFAIDDVKTIAHIATLRDLYVVINDVKGQKISYELNNWVSKYFTNKTFNEGIKLVVFYQKWNDFLNAIDALEVSGVEIIFPEANQEKMIEIKNDFLSKMNLIVESDIFVSDQHLYITPKNAKRVNALFKIAKTLKINPRKNCLYLGVNCYDPELYKYVYLTATSKESLENLLKDHDRDDQEPQIILPNQSKWIQWLNENDYLWSHQPTNPISDYFLAYKNHVDYSKFNLELLSDKNLKVINFQSRSWSKLINKKTNLLSTWTKKNEQSKLHKTRQLPVWEENKKELIQKVFSTEQIK
ncbi:HAD hydrolase family protein [[Mycoplasma] cavipharyngis]|uniref:hypothetical protein n=1 Tax=[Mycoplasma] cavipharyngis TaxID=92757 RepID=UPI0037043889